MIALLEFATPWLLKGAAVLFGLLVTWIFVRLGAWVHHNAWLSKHQRMLALYDRFAAAAELAVKAVGQSYVDALVKSGKFDKGAQEEAKRQAIKTAQQQLGPETWTAMVEQNGGEKRGGEEKALAVLGQHIEAAVAEQKAPAKVAEAMGEFRVPGMDRDA